MDQDRENIEENSEIEERKNIHDPKTEYLRGGIRAKPLSKQDKK